MREPVSGYRSRYGAERALWCRLPDSRRLCVGYPLATEYILDGAGGRATRAASPALRAKSANNSESRRFAKSGAFGGTNPRPIVEPRRNQAFSSLPREHVLYVQHSVECGRGGVTKESPCRGSLRRTASHTADLQAGNPHTQAVRLALVLEF